MTDPPDTFESWADDSQQLLKEVEQHLVGLKALMKKAGIRDAPQGRRLVATMTRYDRVSRLLRDEIETTQDYARKQEALRRLGRRRENKS